MANFITELRVLNIPEELIQKIANHFGGEQIYMPKKSLRMRNNQIEQDYKNGVSVPELSKIYDLTTRRIHDIIAG